MGGVYRPIGRIFSRLSSSPIPSLSSLRVEELPLSIPRSSFWPVHGAPHLHARHEGAEVVPSFQRDLDNILFGRHPGARVVSPGVSPQRRQSSQPSPKSRLHHQFQEVVAGSISELPLSRSPVGLLTSGRIAIDDKKRHAFVDRASNMLKNPRPRCRILQVLLGHMTAALPAVPLMRLHCRFLQRNLNRVYRSAADMNRHVSLSAESLRDLSWICCLDTLQCNQLMWPLLLEECNLEVSTDASDKGWGIYFQGRLHHGLWKDVQDAPAHINAKELHALLIFLEVFLPPSDVGRNLLWRSDSSTALAYVRREGGTQSLPLLRLARKILLFLHRLHQSSFHLCLFPGFPCLLFQFLSNHSLHEGSVVVGSNAGRAKGFGSYRRVKYAY